MPTDVGSGGTMPEAPEVILITGPAGAGKTVAADEWARTRPYPCAHISLDDIRRLVKSGYADPREGWGPEPRRQLELARGSVALLARRFIGTGIGCVVDDAIFPKGPEADYAGWRRDIEGMSHRLVVLFPSLDVVIKRDGERPPSRRLGSTFLKIVHERMTPWRDGYAVPVIDNSCLSVGQTVQAIEAVLGESHRDLDGMKSNKPAQNVP